MAVLPWSATQTIKAMRRITPTPKVSRARAIEIAANHNIVDRSVAEKYTDSELREVLRVLKLRANF